MKKIAVVLFLVLVGFKSAFLYSAPADADEIEEIKNKISALEEEILFLEEEIERDKEISSWVQNEIALRMTRDLLNKDLSEKERMLDNLKAGFGDELKDEISFIGQNIEKEKEIVTGILIDIGTIKYTQAYIAESLLRKNKLMDIFKKKIDELKDKLEKAEK